MNNYLLFKSVLKCHLLPVSKVHSAMWKGSNCRFVPSKRVLSSLASSDEQVNKRAERYAKRHLLKQQKLAALGLDFVTDPN